MRVRTISWKEASLLGDYTIVLLGEQPYRNQAKTTFPVTKTSNFLFLVAIFCFGFYILIKQTAQTAQTECAAESAFFFFFFWSRLYFIYSTGMVSGLEASSSGKLERIRPQLLHHRCVCFFVILLFPFYLFFKSQ